MEVFRYFRIRKNEYLSLKLLVSKRNLWKDVKEEEFDQAIDELIERSYIKKMERPEGWRLLEVGDEYLKQSPLPF